MSLFRAEHVTFAVMRVAYARRLLSSGREIGEPHGYSPLWDRLLLPKFTGPGIL